MRANVRRSAIEIEIRMIGEIHRTRRIDAGFVLDPDGRVPLYPEAHRNAQIAGETLIAIG